jgi:predicted helicase
MLQSGLIRPQDLARKYTSELHANEIMLLAYYIAAVNIETAYQGILGDNDGDNYRTFDGIVLTDTFQLSEGRPADSVYFPRNNARADRQKGLDIRVIIGNPPYSIGQTSANDDNANVKYPTLDSLIEATYAAASSSGNVRSLYDSYIRAIRWASNRIQTSPDGGIVAFVSNGGWLDTNAADGLRRTVATEFHHVYVFNLRGNQRTSGEQSRQEGGKVFGQGSRSTVAITLLVKQPGEVPGDGAQIHYRDIGDYLTREEKLEIVGTSTIESIEWDRIVPNGEGDWINERDPRYGGLLPLAGTDGIFTFHSYGLVTNRDAWVYNSSANLLRDNVESMAAFFNDQVANFEATHPGGTESMAQRTRKAKEYVQIDETRHSWTRGHFQRVARGQRITLRKEMFRTSQYRPFFPQHVAFDGAINEMPSKMAAAFPEPSTKNTVLTVPRYGDAGPSPFALDEIVDLNFGTGGPVLAYPRWRHEEPSDGGTLFSSGESGRVSNLNSAALQRFREVLGDDLEDDDVFAYVYGVLHSPQFRETFAANLKKEEPRVPLVDDRGAFEQFRQAGQEMLSLHVNYETVESYPLVEEWADHANPDRNPDVLRVGTRKMRYPKVTDPETGAKVPDKTRLIYNDHLTLSGIPLEAHDFVLGTRSGVDWIIDRWYVKTDRDSGIVNDVNQWGLEQGQPRYIIDLIKRVVTVSVRSVEIVRTLPRLDF